MNHTQYLYKQRLKTCVPLTWYCNSFLLQDTLLLATRRMMNLTSSALSIASYCRLTSAAACCQFSVLTPLCSMNIFVPFHVTAVLFLPIFLSEREPESV